MDRRFIYDDNKRVKGYIQNDVIYNDMGKIVGYKSGDYITDAPRNGKILYSVSNDGYITEGTSRKIVAQVHENGCITKGTSNRIAGSVDRSSTAAIGAGIPNISGGGLLAVLIGGFLIYFGIIEVPKVIADQFKDIDNLGRITNLLSMLVTITLMCIVSIISNVCSDKFINGLFDSYISSVVVCGISIVIDSMIFDNAYSVFMMLLAVPLVSIVFAMLPALIITCVCWIVKLIVRR